MQDPKILQRAIVEAKKGKAVVVVVASMFEASDYQQELFNNHEGREGGRYATVRLRLGSVAFVTSSGGRLPERLAGLRGPVFVSEPARRLTPSDLQAIARVDPEFFSRGSDD